MWLTRWPFPNSKMLRDPTNRWFNHGQITHVSINMGTLKKWQPNHQPVVSMDAFPNGRPPQKKIAGFSPGRWRTAGPPESCRYSRRSCACCWDPRCHPGASQRPVMVRESHTTGAPIWPHEFTLIWNDLPLYELGKSGFTDDLPQLPIHFIL